MGRGELFSDSFLFDIRSTDIKGDDKISKWIKEMDNKTFSNLIEKVEYKYVNASDIVHATSLVMGGCKHEDSPNHIISLA